MSKALWYLAGGVALVLAVLFGQRAWQSRGNEAAVARERAADTRVAVATAAAKRDSARLASTVAAYEDSLAYWRARPRTVPGPRAPLPATSSDTATLRLLREERAAREAVEALLADVEQRGNALEAGCAALQRDCAAFRVSADSLRLAYAAQVRALRAVIASPPPRRKWGIGTAGGYGAVSAGGRVYTGPGALVGLTLSF